MSSSIQSHSEGISPARWSRVAPVLRRAPLAMATVIFTLISLRYLADPVGSAAAAGIAFTAPGGITIARVGFAGFPLAFAILGVTCLIATRRLLAGLYMVLTVISVVTAVRVLGMVLDHSAVSNGRLLVPESVLIILSLIAIRLETGRRRAEAGTSTGGSRT